MSTLNFASHRCQPTWCRQIIQKKSPAGSIRGQFFLALVLGLNCFSLLAAPLTNEVQFYKPPPKPGSVQWEINQHQLQEQREKFRKRVAIPDAVGSNVPLAEGALSARHPQLMTAQAAAAPPRSSVWLKYFYVAAFAFLGIFAIRKFAPDFLADLNQWFNPWLVAANRQRVLRGKLRAEEESFEKFVATFRTGPTAAAAAEAGSRHDFYPRVARLLATQRVLVQEIIRETEGAARNHILLELRDSVTALKNLATFPEVLPAWQLASAFEGLLGQLTAKVGNLTASTLRTVIGGVNLLDDLCAPGLPPDLLTERPLKFLVVDDDWVSRQALVQALQKAFSPPDLCASGDAALIRLGEQTYDAIFLDVQMPEMDGFELCLKIRATTLNRTTPVVFVSSQSDFNARAKSTLSGGNELMGKPFLTFELTVKALTFALQGRLRGREVRSPAAVQAGRGLEASWLSLLAETPSANPTARPPQPVAVATGSEDFNTAFLTRTAKHLTPLRELCGKMLHAADEASRQPLLVDAFLRINSLISKTNPDMDHPAHQFSVMLERLLQKLLEHSKNVTPAALATVAAAVDLLSDLCAAGLKADFLTQPPLRLLVVDDDLVARRIIAGALQTVFEKPDSVEDGEAALALATEKSFDVIFLDVVMPGMDGFEVCEKIRNTVPNRLTPVIFVSGQEAEGLRERMRRCAGNEFLGKPFLTAELTVKTLTLALRNRLKPLALPSVAG